MSLVLVIHQPAEPPGSTAAEACRAALREAVWEIADSHWEIGLDAVLASSDLSPGYLLSHFRRGLAQRGIAEAGLLLVVPVGPGAARAGLPAQAEAWVAETLSP
jgi:hypothetical protein